MKIYEVITKDGEKFLRLLIGDLESIETLFRHPEEVDGVYIGTAEPGTVLREDQVRQMQSQIFHKGEWKFFDKSISNGTYPTRECFTDAEPVPEEDEEEEDDLATAVMHYRRNHPEPEKPDTQQAIKNIFPLVKLAADAAREAQYWKTRCLAAESHLDQALANLSEFQRDMITVTGDWQEYQELVNQSPEGE